MLRGVLEFDDASFHIGYNPDDLKMVGTVVTIGGETDEEFQTRRNTFTRWIAGLPKKRKQPLRTVENPMPGSKLKITIDSNDLPFFSDWMHSIPETSFCNFSDVKRDCKLIQDHHAYKEILDLKGVFPTIIPYNDTKNVVCDITLNYDWFSRNNPKNAC